MKVAIFTEDLYEDVEFWYPYYRLKEAGHQPVVVGSGRKEGFEGKHGVPNKADMSIHDARSADFDAVVVPGGYAPDKMRLHPEFAQLVRLMTVFFISMILVIGPTPPGTGVMAEAFSATASKSTSPTHR